MGPRGRRTGSVRQRTRTWSRSPRGGVVVGGRGLDAAVVSSTSRWRQVGEGAEPEAEGSDRGADLGRPRALRARRPTGSPTGSGAAPDRPARRGARPARADAAPVRPQRGDGRVRSRSGVEVAGLVEAGRRGRATGTRRSRGARGWRPRRRDARARRANGRSSGWTRTTVHARLAAATSRTTVPTDGHRCTFWWVSRWVDGEAGRRRWRSIWAGELAGGGRPMSSGRGRDRGRNWRHDGRRCPAGRRATGSRGPLSSGGSSPTTARWAPTPSPVRRASIADVAIEGRRRRPAPTC